MLYTSRIRKSTLKKNVLVNVIYFQKRALRSRNIAVCMMVDNWGSPTLTYQTSGLELSFPEYWGKIINMV